MSKHTFQNIPLPSPVGNRKKRARNRNLPPNRLGDVDMLLPTAKLTDDAPKGKSKIKKGKSKKGRKNKKALLPPWEGKSEFDDA